MSDLNLDFIDTLQFGCMVALAKAVEADKDAIEAVVDYLHSSLTEMATTVKQREIIDRMASQIAVEGFKPDYGYYHGLAK